MAWLDGRARFDATTIWAGQYDPLTLEPAIGRTFELVGLAGIESVNVVRYLMTYHPRNHECVTAIESAIRWYRRSTIVGLRVDRVPAETVRYENHTSRDDLVQVADPDAPPLWARFYDIETNSYFMANRDGTKVRSLADVERERRTGYRWFDNTPQKLLDVDYPAWLKSRSPQ